MLDNEALQEILKKIKELSNDVKQLEDKKEVLMKISSGSCCFESEKENIGKIRMPKIVTSRLLSFAIEQLDKIIVVGKESLQYQIDKLSSLSKK